MNKYREIEIDLTGTNDVEFVLDMVKNTPVLTEIYATEYDGDEHFSSVIYINVEDVEEVYGKYHVLENIMFDEYEYDDESIKTLRDTKKATIDDLYELDKLFESFEKMYERYTVVR